MKSIIVFLAFSFLSSVTFSQNARGGWNGQLKHNGVVIHNDTIHVNYGEVVEIRAHTWGEGGGVPPWFLFGWYLDDVLVPLENTSQYGSYCCLGRYELNQPGSWVFRYMPPGNNWSRNVVVVWNYEPVAEALDPEESFISEVEKEAHRERVRASNTVDIVPNPTRDRIKLVSTSKLTQLNILNQAGVIVYSSRPGTNEADVDLSYLARGLYFAETISEHGERTIERILVVD